jgi:4-amino-4-deoxy-L-arabinose transferase-like glycosyltransferase
MPSSLIAAWFIPLLAISAAIVIVRGWGLAGSCLFMGAQVILVVISVTLWPGLLLAEIGHFSPFWLDLILLVVGIGAWGWLKAHKRPLLPLPRPRLTREGIILALILLMAAILFARPAEQITGGADPGVYLTTGINIARTGQITVTDEILAAAPAELAVDILYQARPNVPYRDGSYLPGYYLVDAAEGKILPQFLHLFQIAIAILFQMGGVRLALYATPLAGWLSILMLYLLGRELANPAVALLAAGLLPLNISQLWFARVPFADIALQFLLLAGLWTLTLLVERADKPDRELGLLSLLSGACFGLAHLTKLDSYIVPLIVFGFVGAAWLAGRARRPHMLLLSSYLLLAAQAALHAYLLSLPYVVDVFNRFFSYLKVGAIGSALALLALVLIAKFHSRVTNALSAIIPRLIGLRKPFVVAIMILSVYLYFVRPLRADLGAMTSDEISQQGTVIEFLSQFATEPQIVHYPNRQVRTYTEEGMVRMGWYLTPLGVWLGIAGFLSWSTSPPKPKTLPFLGAAFAYSAITFGRGAVRSDFFWAFKRYIPLVIPAFVLLIAYALWRLWDARSQGESRIIAGVLACFLVIAFIEGSLPFWAHVEFEGAVDSVQTLNSRFPEDAVIFIEQESSTSASRIGTPLRFVFGKAAYGIAEERMRSNQMHDLIQQWLEAGRPVYWVSARGTEIQEYGPVTWLGEQTISLPTHDNELDKLPSKIQVWQANLQIYQVQGAEYNFPADLDVNFGDEIVLMGYQLDKTTATAGVPLQLDLYWYAQKELETDYTVFAHFLDESMMFWGQKDSPPLDGTWPTSGWFPGEIVHDTMIIPTSPDAPAGVYYLSIGLYEWTTMTRLPILGEDGSPKTDHLLLTPIQIGGEG